MSKPTNNLIFDRELADIKNRTSKGYYNLNDLRRINEWIKYLAEMLELSADNYDFLLGEEVSRETLQDVCNHTQKIIDKIYEGGEAKAPHLDPVLSMGWNYLNANELERLLSLANDFAEAYERDSIIAGTFNSGEGLVFRHPTPQKLPSHIITLKSIDGRQRANYEVEIGSFFRLPNYYDVFDNGEFQHWETSEGIVINNMGMFFVPMEAGLTTIIAIGLVEKNTIPSGTVIKFNNIVDGDALFELLPNTVFLFNNTAFNYIRMPFKVKSPTSDLEEMYEREYLATNKIDIVGISTELTGLSVVLVAHPITLLDDFSFPNKDDRLKNWFFIYTDLTEDKLI